MPGASLNPLKPQWDLFIYLFYFLATSVCFSGSGEVLPKCAYNVNTVHIFLKASTKFRTKLMLLGRPRGWIGARQERESSPLIWGLPYRPGRAAGKTLPCCWSHHLSLQSPGRSDSGLLPHREIKGQSQLCKLTAGVAWCLITRLPSQKSKMWNEWPDPLSIWSSLKNTWVSVNLATSKMTDPLQTST